MTKWPDKRWPDKRCIKKAIDTTTCRHIYWQLALGNGYNPPGAGTAERWTASKLINGHIIIDKQTHYTTLHYNLHPAYILTKTYWRHLDGIIFDKQTPTSWQLADGILTAHNYWQTDTLHRQTCTTQNTEHTTQNTLHKNTLHRHTTYTDTLRTTTHTTQNTTQNTTHLAGKWWQGNGHIIFDKQTPILAAT